MADDIVTRLREWHTEWNWYLPDQAADEIERLRADRDRWKNVAELAMQAHLDDCWSHVYEAYEWAVRGE